jgi:hypothetical protein
MPPRVLLCASLVLVLASPALALTKRRDCRAACGGTIQACATAGKSKRACKRQIMARCRHAGVGVCLPPGVWHVATSGADDASCGTTTAPCRTIQFVVDSHVPDGGAATIKVAAGTYGDANPCPTGPNLGPAVVCILSKQIALAGGFSTDDWDSPGADPAATVLDGGGQNRCVRVQGPQDQPASLQMDGFTVRNCFTQGASSGTWDQTYGFGAGLYATNSAVVLRNMAFHDNHVVGGSTNQSEGGRSGGGALAIVNDPWAAATATASLQHVVFDHNTSSGGTGVDQGGDAHGGAIFTERVTLDGDDLTFTDNAAAAGSSDGSGHDGNEYSDALGGAWSVEGGTVATLAHVTATGNTATGGDAPNGEAGGAYGGAFMAEQASLTATDATFSGNVAHGGNGKNVTIGGSLAEGGAIHTGGSSLSLDRVVVVDNLAQGGDGAVNGGAPGGGGVSVTFGTSVDGSTNQSFTIRNTVIADNRVGLGAGALMGGGGAGLWVQATVGTVEHATIAGNHILDNRLLGAGIVVLNYTGWQADATFRNIILANHTDAAFDPTSFGNAALYVAQDSTANVIRPLFANNVHDSNSGVSGGWNFPPGSIVVTSPLSVADAGFVSPGAPNHDYHLLPGSPAVDQAVASDVADDLDGQARPMGAAADIGADEVR